MLYHAVTDPDGDRIWNAILEHEGQTFRTARGLEYTYDSESNAYSDEITTNDRHSWIEMSTDEESPDEVIRYSLDEIRF